MFDITGIFKGNVSDLTDILPCPRCKSLKSKRADIPGMPYYERRYQCVELIKGTNNICGQFYRYDTRPVEDAPQEWAGREGITNIKGIPLKR